MTGPEHYLEAERLLKLAEHTDWTTPEEPYRSPALLAAQAHATLALAAAVAAAVALQVTATVPPFASEAGADWRAVLKPVEVTS